MLRSSGGASETNNHGAGTGEVELAIASATFHPQAAAFTALLKMCAKDRQWEKALEVWCCAAPSMMPGPALC